MPSKGYHHIISDTLSGFQRPKGCCARRRAGVDSRQRVPTAAFKWTSIILLNLRYSGILSKVKFYRVVADEAQFIRNR